MKSLMAFLTAAGVALAASLIVFTGVPVNADPSGSPSTYKKIVSVTFTNSGTFTWLTTDLVSMYSVDMTFTNGTYSNRFDFGYIRNGVTHTLYTATGTYHTIVWYPENNYTFQNGDRIIWSNTAPNKVAVLTLNSNFF